MATVSGYLLTPDFFEYLKQSLVDLQDGEELLSNDALKLMIKDGKKIIAKQIENGKYYDAGNKLEYIKTFVDFALRNEEIGPEFRKYLESIIK